VNENDLRSPVIGLNHVNLHVDDIDAARGFYGHGLGLAELERPSGIGIGVWYRLGPTQLHLSVVAAMPAEAATSTTHVAIQLPSGSFDECIRAIEARGVVLTRQPQTREQLGSPVRTAFCRDPANNLIELTDIGPLD
jgi:catechol 2,3-dioxygenase-like lactoylglutathione lyase family enzyme